MLGHKLIAECLLSRKRPFARGVFGSIFTAAYGRKRTFNSQDLMAVGVIFMRAKQ